MKPWTIVLLALCAVVLVVPPADAKRFGGARSIGKQRQSIGQQYTAPRTPAQQPQQTTPSTPPPQQQPSGASRWLGPLAGLALGAGLASLFLHNGLGGALAGMLLVLAIVFGVRFLVRMLRGGAPGTPMRYAGAEPDRVEPRMPPQQMYAGTPAPHSVAATTSGNLLAGFDAAEFTRHAKANFVRLQAANDARDLATIRDVVTPELYHEIEADVHSRGDAAQKTDVLTLEAEVLDVATEGEQYVVSTRFSGLIREHGDEQPQQFSEIWHLEKPVRGGSGWVIAGIQQA